MKMKVTLNEDAAFVAKMRTALQKKEGYCPCRLEKIDDNFCICKEFRDQINDPDYEGYCHCKLYYKSKD